MNQGSGNPRTQGSPQSFHLFHKMLTFTPPPPTPKSVLLLEARFGLFPDRSVFPQPPVSPLQTM